ncbi:hypothetical protein [Microcella sp.]|uniref:hypothetical protein n=1 Tax=Microcella sp. TaxID=1913979 RepID=UPI00255D5F7A|nr:hypothetical protein [Microcella sp.]MBX9471335.1 hypothetical protein [Microcella sp.]
MDVEAIAVAEVSRLVATCTALKPYISLNDKTPFTDGHVDLYSGLKQSKEQWLGRVDVQVKGRSVKANERTSITFSIKRTDLKAYQKNSGVLYFVVLVEDSGASTTYCALLSPFAIEDHFARSSPTTKNITVGLKLFPTSPSEIQPIFALALKTREQRISQGFDAVLFERMKSLTIHTATEIDFAVPVTLSPGSADFALVLTTEDGLEVPLSGVFQVTPLAFTKRPIAVEFRSGDMAYKGGTAVQTADGSVEIELAAGLSIVFRASGDQHSMSFSFTLERSLADRLKGLEFYAALLATRAISIDGVEQQFVMAEGDSDAELITHLSALRELRELFDLLNVDTRFIDIQAIDDKLSRQLSVLRRAFVHGEEISDPELETSRVLQKVGDWGLMFLVVPGSKPGRWRMVDPFNDLTRQQYRMSYIDEGVRQVIPVTAYDMVEPDQLGTVLNANLRSIVGAYEALSDYSSTFGQANLRVLALIAAADTHEARAEELLEAAIALNNWLIASEGQKPQHLLNSWQMKWRKGGLSAPERNEVRAFRKSIKDDSEISPRKLLLACALLLGEEEEVAFLAGQLTPDELSEMQGWPIWRLRKDPPS